MNQEMILKAQRMGDDGDRLIITTNAGERITGYSCGIEPALDEENEELDFNCFVFEVEPFSLLRRLNNDEIVSVEKA